jgi:Mg/Co/Ni transporter MgtE
MGIQYTNEGKDIIKRFDDLTPWDKGDMIKYLVNKSMTEEEIEKYFIEGSGYVYYDSLDLVQEVIDNDLEDEVLDKMDDQAICDYLIHGWGTYENCKYMFENIDSDDAAKMVDEIRTYSLENILETMIDNYPDTCKKIFTKLAENINKWNHE